jgi:hypothetical protein
MIENKNWCKECEVNCCDHFVLTGWEKARIDRLIVEYDFLHVVEEFEYEERGQIKTAWVIECDRLLPDGDCDGYPDNRPNFCKAAGVVFQPDENCALFEARRRDPDRSE